MDSWGLHSLSYQPEEQIGNNINTIHKTLATLTLKDGYVWEEEGVVNSKQFPPYRHRYKTSVIFI